MKSSQFKFHETESPSKSIEILLRANLKKKKKKENPDSKEEPHKFYPFTSIFRHNSSSLKGRSATAACPPHKLETISGYENGELSSRLVNVNETRETAILESKRIESRFENFFGHRESRSPGEEINRRNSEREVLSKLVRSESKDTKAPRRSGNALREMHVVVERQSLFRHRRRRRRLVPTSTCLIVVPTRNSNVKLSWLTVKFVKSSRNKVGAKFRVRCSWLRAVSPRIGCCFHTKKRD